MLFLEDRYASPYRGPDQVPIQAKKWRSTQGSLERSLLVCNSRLAGAVDL